jgi:hypothetical protein
VGCRAELSSQSERKRDAREGKREAKVGEIKRGSREASLARKMRTRCATERQGRTRKVEGGGQERIFHKREYFE